MTLRDLWDGARVSRVLSEVQRTYKDKKCHCSVTTMMPPSGVISQLHLSLDWPLLHARGPWLKSQPNLWCKGRRQIPSL